MKIVLRYRSLLVVGIILAQVGALAALLIISELGMTHWPTLLVGLTSLALLFIIEKYLPRVPAAITVLVLAIVVSALMDFESLDIHSI